MVTVRIGNGRHELSARSVCGLADGRLALVPSRLTYRSAHWLDFFPAASAGSLFPRRLMPEGQQNFEIAALARLSCCDADACSVSFPVHFIGELRSCSGFLPPRLALTTARLSSLSAAWTIEPRDDRHWRLLEGDASGKTWLSHRETPSEVAAWNTPIDLTFAFTATDGWPMLLLTVFETDAYERQDLGGYGVVRLPTTPGTHIRQIPISRPRGTWSDAATAFFVGGRPRYDHPGVLLTGESRYGHEMVSMGMAELEISVILQGFDEAQLDHVTFDTDRTKAALEATSVCLHCRPSKLHGQKQEDDDEEEEDEKKETQQPLLSRKQQ